MSVQNQKTNSADAKANRQIASKPVDPRVEVVDRGFDAIKDFCNNNPKTAKIIGGTVLTGTGLGIAAGGIVLIKSAF